MENSSVLTYTQFKVYGPKFYKENGQEYRIQVNVRFDDQCKNGHNTLAVTADIHRKDRGAWREDSGGCCHDEVAKHFPELKPLIKFHLCSTDGPLYYIENTLFHALQHPANKAWIFFEDKENGMPRQCMKYATLAEAQALVAKNPLYSFQVDERTAKAANFDHARSSAVWPNATDKTLSLPQDELKAILQARLPKLMEEFKSTVESFGFIW